MYIRLVFSLLLLVSSALADASTPIAIGHSADGHALLGIPRYRGGQQGDTLIIVTAQQGTDQTGWLVSYDRGNSWQDVHARWMVTGTNSPTWYSSDHSAAWFAGGLHIAYRSYSGGDPFGYRYVRAPYASESDMEPADVPAVGTDTYMPMVVANNANDVWVIDQNEGASRDNLRYWHTTDRFATAPEVGRICQIPEDPQNYWRIGAIMGQNGYPKVSVYDFTSGFVIWSYNGSTWDSALVNAASLGGVARYYCHAEMNGLDHIAYSDPNTGELVHFYEVSEGNFDSTVIATPGTDRISPQFCVHGEGANSRLYCVYYTGSAAMARNWTPATGWSSATQVSTPGHNPEDPAMVPRIPSSWNTIPIWYQDVAGNNNIYYLELDAEPLSGEIDTIPPAAINDLGAVTGDEHGTIKLQWSSPGDDDMIGAADAYMIRYSANPITPANWNSATQIPSAPTPQTAGSSQELVIDGLVPDSLYFVGIISRDDAFNESSLSNVDSARAYLDISLDVDDDNPPVPQDYSLSQNYPNPFNPTTRISFSLPTASIVRLDIYNVTGRLVTTLVDGPRSAGNHTVTWDGTGSSSKPVASGIYFCRLSADDFLAMRKMALIR